MEHVAAVVDAASGVTSISGAPSNVPVDLSIRHPGHRVSVQALVHFALDRVPHIIAQIKLLLNLLECFVHGGHYFFVVGCWS